MPYRPNVTAVKSDDFFFAINPTERGPKTVEKGDPKSLESAGYGLSMSVYTLAAIDTFAVETTSR